MIKNNKSKITGLFLKGWQSIIGPQFFDLDGLVFLYGPNSAGKSSLIDALKIIKYAVGENNSLYNIGYHFRENSNLSCPNGVAIGVEFRVGKLSSMGDNEIKIWSQLEDSIGYQPHVEIFEKTEDQRIQVEFSDDFQTIKIAIENSPLMEIRGLDSLNYTDAHARSTDPEYFDEDNFIYGNLVIHKRNPFAKLLFSQAFDLAEEGLENQYSSVKKSYHHDLFVEESDDELVISGINFDAETRNQESYVCIGYAVEDVLFHKCQSNFPVDSENQTDEQKIIYGMFHPESKYYGESKSDRSLLYWKLERAAKDINLFITGIFFHLRDAIEMSYVRADRSILHSRKPMFVTDYSVLTQALSDIEVDKNISLYAEAAAEKFRYRSIARRPLGKIDFVSLAINKYMRSLKDYSVFPISYTLKNDDATAHDHGVGCRVVFLKRKDKDGKILGFEDVGSGFSFFLPVLTALWSSDISFIEQPELHLHPKAQCEIGDVLIAAKNGGSNSIIESHSEHLLLRVLRRIRENSKGYPLGDDFKINNSEVNIYYFDPMPDGHTKIKKLESTSAVNYSTYGLTVSFLKGRRNCSHERDLCY